MKAQSYTLDIIIALTVVTILLTFLSGFIFTQQTSIAQTDAATLAGVIMNPYPEYWNDTTVILPGIAVDHRLDEGLLTNLSLLPQSDINSLTGTASTFFVNVTTPKGAVGTAGTPPSEDAEDVYAVRRYAAFNATIATIEVIAWR